MSQEPSICIPRISSETTKYEISEIFNKLSFGKILKIVTYVNDKTHTQKVFIYFKYWNNNERCNKIKEKLNSGESIKIVHDFPQYWKCFKTKY